MGRGAINRAQDRILPGLINTSLQRGEPAVTSRSNRFNGFPGGFLLLEEFRLTLELILFPLTTSAFGISPGHIPNTARGTPALAGSREANHRKSYGCCRLKPAFRGAASRPVNLRSILFEPTLIARCRLWFRKSRQTPPRGSRCRQDGWQRRSCPATRGF